jgi:hypothetical protein
MNFPTLHGSLLINSIGHLLTIGIELCRSLTSRPGTLGPTYYKDFLVEGHCSIAEPVRVVRAQIGNVRGICVLVL